MLTIKRRSVVAAVFLWSSVALLLLGCGGGGGGGENPNSGSLQPPATTARPLSAHTLKLLTADPLEYQDLMIRVEGTGDVLRYEWDLGNGSKRSSDMPVIQHRFDEGEYDVAVTVLGKAGDTAIAKLKVSVRHEQPQIFIETFGRAEIPLLRDGIQYFASRLEYGYDRNLQRKSTVPEGNSYLWDFGDGQQAVTAAASHVYAKAGDYTVTLTLTDRYGRSTSAKQDVKVSAASAWPMRTSLGGPGYEDRGSLSLFNDPAALVRAPDGTLFVYDRGNSVVRRIAKDGSVSTLAGAKGPYAHSRNGKGGEARFEGIGAMALGADGMLYLASSGLRSLSPDRSVALVVPYSNTPKDGAAATASVNGPRSVAVRKDGAVYVDSGASIRLLKGEQLSHVAGQMSEHGAADGPAEQARFGDIKAMALDPQERLLILDGCGGLRRLDADGQVGTLVSWKTLDPAAKECGRNDYRRAAIAAAADGTIYLAASGISDRDSTATILRLGPDGRLQETLRTSTRYDVSSLAVDGNELLFTVSGGHTIQRLRSNGTIVAEAGRSVEDEANTLPTYPPAPYLRGEGLYQSMALTKQGDAVFSDSGRLMLFLTRDRSMQVLYAPPRSITQTPTIDGPRGIAQVSHVWRVATGGADQIYFSDRSSLRRYEPDGRLSTLAGAPHEEGDADGPGHLARFRDIRDIAVDASDKVYVLTTTGDNKSRVALVDPTGAVRTLLRSEVRFTRLLLTVTGRLVLQADYDPSLQILAADGSLASLSKLARDFVSWAAHPDGSVWVLVGARDLDLGSSRELVRIEPDGSMKSALQLSTVQKMIHYALAPMELNMPASAMVFEPNGTLLLMGEGAMRQRQALPGSFWRLEDLPSGR